MSIFFNLHQKDGEMGGNWKCCSEGFEYVQGSKRRPGSIVVLGALGILERDKGFGWRGKVEVVLDRSSDMKAIGKDLGLLSAGNRK